MQEFGQPRVHPELRELVTEASRALARLDADRLEELAHSCRALNRDLIEAGAERRGTLECQSMAAEHDMGVFARILEVTRGNLNLMNRLRDLREGRLEYGDLPSPKWTLTERGHGDD